MPNVVCEKRGPGVCDAAVGQVQLLQQKRRGCAGGRIC
jgi:hypothetical protein